MAGGRWKIVDVWEAAVAVTADAYGADPAEIRAQSRGRGPRPPVRAREPKKMAVHLVVIVADCSYADLARAIGLHKDTIASHCAEMRELVAVSDADETAAQALETLVRFHLDQVVGQRISAMRAHLAMLAGSAGELLGAPQNPSSVIHPPVHPSTLARSRKRENEGEAA